MLFHPVDKSIKRAVQTGDFADGAGVKVGRSSLGLGEEVSQTTWRKSVSF